MILYRYYSGLTSVSGENLFYFGKDNDNKHYFRDSKGYITSFLDFPSCAVMLSEKSDYHNIVLTEQDKYAPLNGMFITKENNINTLLKVENVCSPGIKINGTYMRWDKFFMKNYYVVESIYPFKKCPIDIFIEKFNADHYNHGVSKCIQ